MRLIKNKHTKETAGQNGQASASFHYFFFFSPHTLTVTFHMFIKIITAGRENPQAVAASPLEVFHF